MRTYELIFILKPDLAEEEAERIISQVEGGVTSLGGALRKTTRMGKRRLAYGIGKYREGQYVLLDLECNVSVVQELERRLKVMEQVIKYQSVRVDEELKRAAKLQQVRAKRAAHKKSSPSAEAAAAPPA
jgi:small subunit ribosomal protein S6